MKQGAPNHPKMHALARLLGVGVAQAIGHVELLSHWTACYAPAGDVGRFEDGEIEKGCAWEGEPGALIAALVRAGWLQTIDTDARLLLLDWSDWRERRR